MEAITIRGSVIASRREESQTRDSINSFSIIDGVTYFCFSILRNQNVTVHFTVCAHKLCSSCIEIGTLNFLVTSPHSLV